MLGACKRQQTYKRHVRDTEEACKGHVIDMNGTCKGHVCANLLHVMDMFRSKRDIQKKQNLYINVLHFLIYF